MIQFNTIFHTKKLLEKNKSNSDLITKYFISKNNTLLLLSIICLVALVLRLYYIPYNVPITHDGFSGYFLHALYISILGNLPNYSSTHSGWSEFLSLFFMIFHSDNFIDYMNLQRIVSVVLSVITIIPIYFICKFFFNNYYSLIGATVFAFNPKIILNSTLGISESLYILAITLGILFFLHSNKKIIYLSFGFFAWATIIRSEGAFWFVAFTIIYFLRFRKNRKDCIMFLVALTVFLLVLSPFVYQRILCCESTAIIERGLGEINNNNNNGKLDDQNKIFTYGPNWINGIKLFGWSIIPIFIIFVPIGLITIFKQMKYPNYLLVLVPIILAIPVMYALSIAPDTRYVYSIFPIFCVIVLFGISWIVDKFHHKKLVLSLILIGMIMGSMAFLEINKIDYSGESEVYQVSKFVANNVDGINSGSKIEKYMMAAEMANRWPVKSTPGDLRDTFKVKQFTTKEIKTFDEFIIKYKDQKLTHIVVDDYTDSILSAVYHNGKKIPYLEKIYDSKEYGYKYSLKLYKINYESFSKYELSIAQK